MSLRLGLLALLIALFPVSKLTSAAEHKIDAFAGLGPNFANNAFFSEDHEQGDSLFVPAYGLRFAGPLSESLSYYAEAYLNNERHDRFTDLNGELMAVLVDLVYSKGPWTIKARYFPEFNYSENFDTFQLGMDDFFIHVMRHFDKGKLSITPRLFANRTESTSPNVERSRAGGGLDLGYTLVEDKLSLSFGWTSDYAMYDEPVGGVERRDWRHQFYAGLGWQINDRLSTGVDVAFARNDSSIVNASWSRFDVTPLCNLTMKLGRIQQ